MTWTSVQPFASRNKTGLIVLLVVCSLIIGTISGPWVVEEPRDISDSEIAGNHSKRSVDDLSTKVNFDQSPDDLAIFFTDSELYHDFIETQKVVSHYDSLMAARIRFIKPLPEIFDVEGIKIVSSAVYNQAIPLHSTYQSSAPSESFDASIRLKQDSSSDLSQLSLLNIAPVHSLGYFGEGIRIGLVDNGVDFNHPGLSHLENFQASFNEEHPVGIMTHGTAVVSSMSGIKTDGGGSQYLGPAPQATIISAAMGTPATMLNSIAGDFLGAFDYLIGQDVDIINTSFGGSPFLWEPIVDRLEAVGILVIGSAGNDGDSEMSPFIIGGPGSVDRAISVGGILATQEFYLSTSSGPTRQGVSKPDVVAMSYDVVVADSESSEYKLLPGTSFGSPLVAGAIALMKEVVQKNSLNYTNSELKAELLVAASIPSNLSQTINMSHPNYHVGYGIPNIDLAIDSLLNSAHDALVINSNQAEFSNLGDHLRGSNQSLDLYLITSIDPAEIRYNVTGDISSLVVQTGPIDTYEQVLPLAISSGVNTPFGEYSGVITIYSETTTNIRSIPIAIEISKDLNGYILQYFGLTDRHHYDELGPFGLRTQGAAQVFRDQGYELHYSHKLFSSTLLDDYDVLWLPDLLTLTYVGTPAFEREYNDQTINTLHNYVENGGNLFIDFIGSFTPNQDPNAIPNAGTDVNVLNQFLSKFNVAAKNLAFGGFSGATTEFVTLNETDMQQYVEVIEYRGNYLEIVDDANPLSVPWLRHIDHLQEPEFSDRLGIVTYQEPNAGKVVITSSNWWFDSCILVDQYCPGEARGYTLNSKVLLTNIISYLQDTTEVILFNVTQSGNDVKGVIYSNTGLPLQGLIQEQGLSTQILQLRNLTQNWYDFAFTLVGSSDHVTFILTSGDDFRRFTFDVDVVSPKILITSNEDAFQLPYTIKATIIEKSSFEVALILDDLFVINQYSVNPTTTNDEYLLEVPLSNLQPGLHTITIRVVDIQGFNASLVYEFEVLENTASITPTISASSVRNTDTTSLTSGISSQETIQSKGGSITTKQARYDNYVIIGTVILMTGARLRRKHILQLIN